MGRFANVWRPWNFHYHRFLDRPADRFEGWYYKLVDPDGERPMAVIPGVFLGERDRHAFVQVLDGRAGTSWVLRYPVSDFSADPDDFDVRIGPSRFWRGGLDLDLAEGDRRLRAAIRLGPWSPWPVTALSPGVMGPFSFAPFMECFHGILSLDHPISGHVDEGGERRVYDGGRGYLEKDWGQGFPRAYVWAQSNHFERPGVCVTVSVAHIPFLGTSFRGFLGGFLLDGALHRFTTYNGGRVAHIDLTETHLDLVLENRTHRLEVSATRTQEAMLFAPYEGMMLERVAETMTSTVDVRLSDLGGAVRFEGRGTTGCLEAQGELPLILGR